MTKSAQVKFIMFASASCLVLRAGELKSAPVSSPTQSQAALPPAIVPAQSMPTTEPDVSDSEPGSAQGLELVWKLAFEPDRLIGGIVSDPERGVVYALAPAFKAGEFKRCVQINELGKIEREFSIDGGNIVLRGAHLHNDVSRDLLSYTRWTSPLRAVDTNGKTLWTYAQDGSIDDVWAADLNGDGLDEVIIGFNGDQGMHVLDNHGQKLWVWQGPDIGNIDRVTAVDFRGDGSANVVVFAQDEDRALAIFDSNGKRLPNLHYPEEYSPFFRALNLSSTGRQQGMLVSKSGKKRIGALKADGNLAWEFPMALGIFLPDDEEPAPKKPWFVLHNLSFLVVDTSAGKIIAKTDKYESQAKSCWLLPKGESSPLLLRSTTSGIEAFRIVDRTPQYHK